MLHNVVRRVLEKCKRERGAVVKKGEMEARIIRIIRIGVIANKVLMSNGKSLLRERRRAVTLVR